MVQLQCYHGSAISVVSAVIILLDDTLDEVTIRWRELSYSFMFFEMVSLGTDAKNKEARLLTKYTCSSRRLLAILLPAFLLQMENLKPKLHQLRSSSVSFP